MKLNPPDTAPDDGTVILARFAIPGIVPARWDASEGRWWAAYALDYSDEDMPHANRFLCCHVRHVYLRGWLPMPTLDNCPI